MSLPDTVPEEIRRELASGEHLQWWGRPRQGLVLRASDALRIPFSLLWCGFAIFWEWNVVTAPHVPPFFMLWGMPFVGVGIYMVAGRFFVDARQRSVTHYALTNERVLIVSGVLARRLKSLTLKNLPAIELALSGTQGMGTISFGSQAPLAFRTTGSLGWMGSERQSPQFELIPEAKAVYASIRAAQRA